MDVRRKRFLAALALFLLWVAVLGTLAARSARRPVARTTENAKHTHQRASAPSEAQRTS